MPFSSWVDSLTLGKEEQMATGLAVIATHSYLAGRH